MQYKLGRALPNFAKIEILARSALYCILVAAAAFFVGGCGSASNSAAFREARVRYGEKMHKIRDEVDHFDSAGENSLKVVLDDADLTREQKSAKIDALLEGMIANLNTYASQVRDIQPPSDLQPLHRFFVEDVASAKAIYIEFRDAFKAGDQERLQAISDRANAYYRERKEKLRKAYQDSGLSQEESLESLKTAIASRKLGSGAGFWGSLWEGLALFLRWETWLAVVLYAVAVFGSKVLMWSGARKTEGAKEGSGCLVGCLGSLLNTAVQFVAMGVCVSALLPVIAGTGGFALGEAISLWKPILTAGFLALIAIFIFGSFFDAFPGGTHLVLGGAIVNVLVTNAKKQAGLSGEFELPLLQMFGMLVVATFATYLIVLGFGLVGVGVGKLARVQDEEKVEGWTTAFGYAVVAGCQWLPLLWYARYLLNLG